MSEFIFWLKMTPWSVALRESFFTWPILEASHVMAVMVFLGTIAMVDLRILNVAFKNISVPHMEKKILPWTVTTFIILIVTGLILFYAKPMIYYEKLYFRIKMVLIILAMINILVFHFRVMKNPSYWAQGGIPQSAKAAAGISLSLWIGVVIFGRFIAYDFVDCPKLREDNNETLSFLAGCRSAEEVEDQTIREYEILDARFEEQYGE